MARTALNAANARNNKNTAKAKRQSYAKAQRVSSVKSTKSVASKNALNRSALSIALSKATRSVAIMPLVLGVVSYHHEALAFDQLMDKFASNGSYTFNSDYTNAVSETGTAYLSHHLTSGELEWNAEVTFTGNHYIIASAKETDDKIGVNYHGTGKLILDMGNDDEKQDSYELAFDAYNLGTDQNLTLSLDTIEVKNGYLNFDSPGCISLLDAKYHHCWRR